MKKTDSTEEVLGLVVKSQRGRSKNRGPKRDPEGSSSYACYYCRKSGHIKKNCMKYKEMMKNKDSKDFDRVNISRKSDQVRVVKQADENPYDVLKAQSGREST